MTSEKAISQSDDERRDDTDLSDVNKKETENDEDITLGLTLSDKIYCREIEKKSIKNFLSDGDKKGIYISGQPGTGKTSLVLKLVEELKSSSQKIFDIYINCYCFQSFDEFYNKIFENLEENRKQILKLLKPEHYETFNTFLRRKKSSNLIKLFLTDLLNEINLFL